jgi:hypothetical protein
MLTRQQNKIAPVPPVRKTQSVMLQPKIDLNHHQSKSLQQQGGGGGGSNGPGKNTMPPKPLRHAGKIFRFYIPQQGQDLDHMSGDLIVRVFHECNTHDSAIIQGDDGVDASGDFCLGEAIIPFSKMAELARDQSQNQEYSQSRGESVASSNRSRQRTSSMDDWFEKVQVDRAFKSDWCVCDDWFPLYSSRTTRRRGSFTPKNGYDVDMNTRTMIGEVRLQLHIKMPQRQQQHGTLERFVSLTSAEFQKLDTNVGIPENETPSEPSRDVPVSEHADVQVQQHRVHSYISTIYPDPFGTYFLRISRTQHKLNVHIDQEVNPQVPPRTFLFPDISSKYDLMSGVKYRLPWLRRHTIRLRDDVCAMLDDHIRKLQIRHESGQTFKTSEKKADAEWQVQSTNLHFQMFSVEPSHLNANFQDNGDDVGKSLASDRSSSSGRRAANFDCNFVTLGVPAAHCMKFSNGRDLRSLHSQRSLLLDKIEKCARTRSSPHHDETIFYNLDDREPSASAHSLISLVEQVEEIDLHIIYRKIVCLSQIIPALVASISLTFLSNLEKVLSPAH